MPKQPKKIKRRRGGQPGNQNARKHGFYSSTLTPEENCRLLNLARTNSMELGLAVLRVKLESLALQDPNNIRAFQEAVRLFVKWSVAQYSLTGPDVALMKAVITRAVQEYHLWGINRSLQASSGNGSATQDESRSSGVKTPRNQLGINEPVGSTERIALVEPDTFSKRIERIFNNRPAETTRITHEKEVSVS